MAKYEQDLYFLLIVYGKLVKLLLAYSSGDVFVPSPAMNRHYGLLKGIVDSYWQTKPFKKQSDAAPELPENLKQLRAEDWEQLTPAITEFYEELKYEWAKRGSPEYKLPQEIAEMLQEIDDVITEHKVKVGKVNDRLDKKNKQFAKEFKETMGLNPKPADSQSVIISFDFDNISTPMVWVGSDVYEFSPMRDSKAFNIISHCLASYPNKTINLDRLKDELKAQTINVSGLTNITEKLRKTVFGKNQPLGVFIIASPQAIMVKPSVSINQTQLQKIQTEGTKRQHSDSE